MIRDLTKSDGDNMTKIMIIENLELLEESQEQELLDFMENRLDYKIYNLHESS